jgi:osmoprotectant transport system permease protein
MSFLGAVPATVLADPSAPGNPWFSWRYVQQNSDAILTALKYHAELTGETILVAALIALPLAILAYWVRALAAPIIGICNTLYIIPSLALIAVLAPFTGIGSKLTILIPVTMYALMLIVNNALTGLQRVPTEVVDAATGMGYGRVGRLVKVELPLALPAIMTGIRLATVSTVALVTVGVVAGQGGLGQLIASGLTNDFYKAPVMTGTVLCVALGLVLDLILLGITRLITPWTRRAVAR